jgi:hypothetical protein
MRMTTGKKFRRGRRVASTARISTSPAIAGPATTSPSPTGLSTANSAPAGAERPPDNQIPGSALSLHQLFEQQTRQMLDRTDLDEEQKQNILIAMSCPCCGAATMSYTAKLKR